jgi:cytosolic 5'-nucleotidase 3
MVGKLIKLLEIPCLQKPHVKIRDPDKLEVMINELIKGGQQKLQLVTDFDKTLTKHRLANGVKVPSSHEMFEECTSLTDHFRSEATKLRTQYLPLEISPTLSMADKIRYSVEWYTKKADLLKGLCLSHEEIDRITAKYKDTLRDGTEILFDDLNKLGIPCLVFSAGLGDCVVGVLKHAKILHPNVKVVSNFLQYKDGLVNGYQKKIIHTFNKNETALKGTDYYELVHSRDHVIVMGDSLGDAGMAEGMPNTAHILKIGFLFDHVRKLRKSQLVN